MRCLRRLFRILLHCHGPPAHYPNRIQWTVDDSTRITIFDKENVRMALILPLGGPLRTLKVRFLDALGNDALVDGFPLWQVTNSDLFALTPSADGLFATVSRVGPMGSGQVSVQADADLGTGVHMIIGTLDLEAPAGEATTVQIDVVPEVAPAI